MKKNYLLLRLVCTVLLCNASIYAQTYCTPTFKNPTQNYISRVQLNTINNTSTFPATGSFNNFTGMSTNLTMGQSYSLIISTVRANTGLTGGYSIWIDYNNDGDFNDVSEAITTVNPSATSPQTMTINVPTNVTTGAKRLRINMVTYYTPGSCPNDTANFGETEDYTVSIVQPVNPIATNDSFIVVRNSTAGVSNQINVATNDLIGTAAGSDGNDYSIAGSPLITSKNGTVTEVSDGVFQYIPANNFMGVDSFIYTFCNTANTCVTATVTINVNLGACIPVSNSSATSFITKFKIYNTTTTLIDNASGNNGGYGNFLGLPAPNLTLGNTYSVDLDTNGSNLGWSLYLDLNQDGDFVDAGERLYNTGGEEPTPFVIRSITIPGGGLSGQTIMRVGTRRYWSSTNVCGQTAQPEEFEDYIVNMNLNPLADIGVVGNSSVINSGSTTTSFSLGTNFGIVDVNSGLKTIVYTITNYGVQDLVLGSVPVSLQAGSSSTFSIVSQPAANLVLTRGQTANFSVSFNPSSTTSFTGSIVINSNDIDENPFVFAIQGEGAQIYQDVDGDAVNANIDVDDDNDGISDTQEQINCLANSNATVAEVIFLNENFGAGLNRARINGVYPGVTTTYCFEDGTSAIAEDECDGIVDLDDGKYTVHYSVANGDGTNQISPTGTDLANWSDQYWYSGQDHTLGDVNGRMAIFNASYDPGVFYETEILGTIPSVPINYSFWAININKANSVFGTGINRILPNVSVKFLSLNRTIVYGTYNTGNILRCNSDPTENCAQSEWKNFSTSITIPTSSFIVQFVNNAPGGLGNDLALDDIKISQNLCDLDADGVADVLDIDNDNDGIPNLYETLMVANPDPDRDATSFGTAWTDTNGNGLSDIYEGLTPADSDGDGVPNYIDLDSDNDSIFDNVEADGKGDIDVNGDGTGDGTDSSTNIAISTSDGDGYLDIVDLNDTDANSNDFGTTGYVLSLDSDFDGIPDYLDSYDNSKGKFNISETIYAALDTNNDGKIDNNSDLDNDGILDNFDTNDTSFGSPRDLNNKYSLYFDGRNDYIEESTSVLGGVSKATLMAFIKLDSSFSNKGTLIADENLGMSINAAKQIEINYNGSNYIIGTTTVTSNIWTQITAVFDATGSHDIKIFVNGDLIGSIPANSPVILGNNILKIGGSPATSSTGFFKGEIEEVRIFNTALTEDQVRKIIYQEIKTTDFSKGEIIPLSVPNLVSNSLVRYYRMDTFKDDIVDNLVTPVVDLNSGAKLHNFKKIEFQTAPLPYVSIQDGSWDASTTWKYGDMCDLPNKKWTIAQVKNNITINHSSENIGLLIDENKTLSTTNNSGLKNTWYLKLDGKLDLEGRSQLLQTEISQLEVTSAGYIEREQDGIANKYNYNYWSSPVSTISTGANNSGYTISGLMKDATNSATIQNINFVTSPDGAQTTPISISTRWLYKFQNLSDSYSNWTAITPTSPLEAGQGYLMKGVASLFAGERQNYAFIGKPNNGTILVPVASNNLNLSGNPYPSAIDSQQFILDNIDGGNIGSSNAITGALYFWEHAPENNTHILRDYKGGYATLNLVGGLPPMLPPPSTPIISGLGTSSKIPNRYIPVGQGFFVKGDVSGGNITFKNSQRAFKIETDNSTTGSNTLFRTVNSTAFENEIFKKIRLKFTTVDNIERQILLGFMNQFATDSIEAGYDAVVLENNPSDFYFINSNEKLIIQGVGSFDVNNSYPLGFKTNLAGNIKIKAEGLENFEANQNVFLFDNLTGEFYDIKNNTQNINIAIGTYDNRFSLKFVNQTLSNNENVDIVNQFSVFYLKQVKSITIKNQKIEIKNVFIYDVLGKQVASKTDVKTTSITIPVEVLSTGTYIVKIQTEKGDLTKKVIVY